MATQFLAWKERLVLLTRWFAWSTLRGPSWAFTRGSMTRYVGSPSSRRYGSRCSMSALSTAYAPASRARVAPVMCTRLEGRSSESQEGQPLNLQFLSKTIPRPVPSRRAPCYRECLPTPPNLPKLVLRDCKQRSSKWKSQLTFCCSCSKLHVLPWHAASFHVIGQCDVMGPDIILPLL